MSDGRFALRVAAVAVATALGLVLVMALFEESLIFFPSRYPDGAWDVGAVARGSGCVLEDRFYPSDDGPRLHSWWCRRNDGGPNDPVVVLFHGNAGNLSDRADMVLELATRAGVDVLIAGYRGYGRSEGRPSEQGLYADARAAWHHVTGDLAIDPARVILFGKSLGGAVAVNLATETDPSGLIVESSFTSIPEMAAHHYPFVPRFLVRTKMDSLRKIGGVECPKLFIHSRADQVVPFEFGRALYEAASQPKLFHEVIGAGHNETMLVGGEAYFEAIRGLILAARKNGGADATG